MTKKEEKDIDFGVVDVKTCDFCKKTVKTEFFYPIEANRLNLFFMFRNDKKINEGICFNCMLKGIFKVCDNDIEEIKKYLDLYLKNEALKKMGS